MKKLLVILLVLIPIAAFSQDNSAQKPKTKFEAFSSKTGSIVKFYDISLPKMSVSYSTLETGIRVLNSESNVYFYRLVEPATSTSRANIAMIEYSDLVEINKALAVLISEVESDVATNPEYLENKFRTEDGFEIGYYVREGKARWFMNFDGYGNSTVFVKKQEELVTAFKNAQTKIEELKQ